MVVRQIIICCILLLLPCVVHAQFEEAQDEMGGTTFGGGGGNRTKNFNPHNKDTSSQEKEIPKGIYVWRVDRRFGDRIKEEVDTLPHLYPQSTMGMGRYGQYNTLGSNYTARFNRIFIDRPSTSDFFFTDVYSQVLRRPDEWHFTNTLSPITNLSYGSCGDKTNGEDFLDVRFAANFSKRFGFGFNIDYAYARGYFQNQSVSHFGATLYTSYLGDQYQLHALLTNHHQKATENGGLASDDYVTHPERSTEDYAYNEIPTILSQNWNRNDHLGLFLTHRYAMGFYRKVPMTEEEIKARKFAEESKAEKEKKEKEKEKELQNDDDGMTELGVMSDSLQIGAVEGDSLDANMKREFVPVTSIIHTFEVNSYDRKYQAYAAPDGYYADTYFDRMWDGYQGDSIFDQTKLLNTKNTLAIALLEGFNKYVPAGLKGFVSYEMRRYDMPSLDSVGVAQLQRWNEHNVSIGGQLQRTQGQTLHYNLLAETWLAGEDAGQMKLEGQTDLNFRLLGDTVRLDARAHFYRLHSSFVHRRYHSKHLWWDNDGLSKETRTRIEGSFTYEKTKTTLRVAVEEIQNYTYLGMTNTFGDEQVTGLSAGVRQYSSNLNILTAQLDQKLRLGPLNWNNILTYQSSSNQDVLPLPTLNVFSNLYLQFMVAHVLRVELGASATWFTSYYAPDFCPQLNHFAVQENADTRMELGEYPFVDAYANLHLKHARFFIMMSNVVGNSGNRMAFLAPHYPQNRSVLHFGVSWNFFN